MPAYEEFDSRYGGAWWNDPHFSEIREFCNANDFPYDLWTHGAFADILPRLLERRYGIPESEFRGKNMSEILLDLYASWGIDDLMITFLRGAKWDGGIIAADYDAAMHRMDKDEIFFFHSDHLGSGSVITDGNGSIYQTLSYMPFGETLIDLKNGDYDELYKFTGHHKDQESGLYYAHARYYDAELGIFRSVEPLAERRPWLTGYHYCSNNPVNRIDPDGRFDILGGTALTRGMMQFFATVANMSDLQDGFVLLTAVTSPITGLPASQFRVGVNENNQFTLDFRPATFEDIDAAKQGAFIPAVSGSAVKKVETAIDNVTSNVKNFNLAGKVHPKTGVPFNNFGFPDFTNYLYKGGANDVKIIPTGDRAKDFVAANKAAGYDATPKGYNMASP